MIESFPELKFLGSGDAFNIEKGNTSAYFIFKNTLILIDCGETVFSKIINLKLLNDIRKVIVLITHLHSDHVGSLGTFVAHLKYECCIKVEIYVPNEQFIKCFDIMGISHEWYIGSIPGHHRSFELVHDNNDRIVAQYIPTQHKPEMNCYGILMNLLIYESKPVPMMNKNKYGIYYSGDSIIIPNEILVLLINGKLNRIYQDTCSYFTDNMIHMNVDRLAENIPVLYRDKIYCMHINKFFNTDLAISYGFNIVENE